MNDKENFRIISKYAYFPTKIEFIDGTNGYIWLGTFEELQEYKDDFQRLAHSSMGLASVSLLYYSKEYAKSWQCISRKKKHFLLP